MVEQALALGHEVVALVRDPGRMALKHPRLVVMGGSPTAARDVEPCVKGADAVIHCLGIGGKGDGKPTTLISDSVKVVLAAMRQQGVPRILCMSNIGAGGSGTWIANRIFIPLFLRWLLPIIDDKDRMEEALRASAVEWVSVRLPNIVEGPEKPVRVSADGRGIGLSITAASAARFLLEQVKASDYLRSAPSISN
ncbi:MAG: NAD(P)H-binding protein [Roseomonas sp.]|nr:NAD(P)H-binding protein [Roseomonas sp.]